MKAQRPVILAWSVGLNVAGLKGVSVKLAGARPLAEWIVVPQASMPVATGKSVVPANAELLVQELPVKFAPAPVLSNFTTTDSGRMPVSVL